PRPSRRMSKNIRCRPPNSGLWFLVGNFETQQQNFWPGTRPARCGSPQLLASETPGSASRRYCVGSGISEKMSYRTKITVRLLGNYLSATRRSLPDFLIIGAQKAGTSSLFEYLAKQSSIQTSLIKEVQYFTRRHWVG